MPSARDGAATARLPLPAPLAAEGARLPDGEPTAQLVRPLAPQRADGPPPDPPAWDGGDALDDAPSAEPWPVRRAVRRRGFSVDGFRAAMVWVRRVIVFTLVAVLLSPLLVAFRVWYVARQDSTPRSDAVIVLGAAQYNGTPSPVFQWRLKHAARLYREKVAPVIVTVGGGQPGDRYTEAASGRRWLADHGVPASKIVAVGEGADTQQSLVAVGREFRRRDWTSAVLVSDPWHALRARTMARDQGITAETSPTRSGPIVQTRGTQARYIIRETGGYLQYVLEGSG